MVKDLHNKPEEYFQRYLDQMGQAENLDSQVFLSQMVPDAIREEVRQLILQNEATVRSLKERYDAAKSTSSWKPGAVVFGSYRLTRKLGSGSSSVVWEALDLNLDHPVALKILRGLLFDSRSIDRLRLEAQVLAGMDCAGVVRLFTTVFEADTLALITECVGEGETLHGLTATTSSEWHAMSLRQRCAVLLEPLKGLSLAHAKGILHRDIKPSNLLWSGKQLKLADFGLATRLDDLSTATLSGEFVGTHAYAAPEQQGGEQATTRSDVFSFGATLYEGLTGSRLFDGPNVKSTLMMILSGQRPWSKTFDALPRDLRAILKCALQHQASNRYADAEAFASDLNAWLERRPVVARLPSLSEQVRLWVHRNPWPSFAGVILAAGLVISISFEVKASRAKSNALNALQIAQGIIQNLDPLLPASQQGSRRARLADLRTMLQSDTYLPKQALAELWATVGTGFMSVRSFPDAANAFRQALEKSPQPLNQVKLAWCLINSGNSVTNQDAEHQVLLTEAFELLEPLALREWTDNDEMDFVTALARNRLTTVQMFLQGDDFLLVDCAEQYELLDETIQARPGFEGWLGPMNLVNLGVCRETLGHYAAALDAYIAAENTFRENGLGSHSEMVYAMIGKYHCLQALDRSEDAAEAAARAVGFVRNSGRGYTQEAIGSQLEWAGILQQLERHDEAAQLREDAELRKADPRFEGK
jgi:serine/threonine protein kinase